MVRHELSWKDSHHVTGLMEQWQKSSSWRPLTETRGTAKKLVDQLTDANNCEALTPTNTEVLVMSPNPACKPLWTTE